MRYCFLLGLLAFFSNSKAQITANGWIIEDIHGPSQVGIVDSIPVDLNQDGLMDVVSASIEDGHLRAYINQGGYQFEQEYISKDVPGIYRVSATDINQDGQTDFLLPSIATHEIIALIKEANGYNKQIIASAVVLPTDAGAADFNQDGLMDVVSISYENHELLLHQQEPGGTFQTQVMSFSAQKPRKLHISDFNNDGLPDILLSSSGDDSVRLFSNLGNATFAENLISNQMTGTRYVTECNINNDNLMDFAVSATADDTVFIFANTGNNQFDPKPIDNNLPGANALHCADIDNDQQTELVSVASNSGNIYTHELTGNLDRQLIANTRDGYVSVKAAAFDQNHPPQILTQAYYENRNLLYATVVSNQEIVVWEDFPDGAIAVVEGDVNGDGIDDVVLASFRDDRVQWYDGITYEHHVVAEKIDGASEVFVTDLDTDGNMDILSAASFANSFYWHRNLGNQLFETITIFDNALFANGIATGDIDNDGKLDVVGTSGSDDSVRWFDRINNEFSETLIDNLSDGPNEVLLSDLNSDTLVDIVVPYYFSNEATVFQNQGDGNFEKIVVYNNILRAYDVVHDSEYKEAFPLFFVSSVSTGDVFYFQLIDGQYVFHILQTNLPQLNWFKLLPFYGKLIAKSNFDGLEKLFIFDYRNNFLQMNTEFKNKESNYFFGFLNDKSHAFKSTFVDIIFSNSFSD